VFTIKRIGCSRWAGKCKANGLEPFAYLQYVFKELPSTDSIEAMEALLPWRLSPAAIASSA
jgi:hypothetical protein